MAEPFLGEIRIMSFNFPPKGWAFCNGQMLPINQNQALFSLLGTNYGGNGQTTFGLPDLRASTPIHRGAGYTLGAKAGEQNHTLTIAEMPNHPHILQASTNGATNTNTPDTTTIIGKSNPQQIYGPANNLTAMDPGAVANAGASQPHQNMQPFLTLTFCIALQGVFPSQN